MGMKIWYEHNVPTDIEVIKNNCKYFDEVTGYNLDERADSIVLKIDDAVLTANRTRFRSNRFFLNGDSYVYDLSAGCKTLLNIMYNPDKCFDLRECGAFATFYAMYYLDGMGIFRCTLWSDAFPIECEITYNGTLYRDIYSLSRILQEDR